MLSTPLQLLFAAVSSHLRPLSAARSASFNSASGECTLSEVDRFTAGPGDTLSADPDFEYYESNCVSDPVRMCQFEPIRGKILKTVDVVFQVRFGTWDGRIGVFQVVNRGRLLLAGRFVVLITRLILLDE